MTSESLCRPLTVLVTTGSPEAADALAWGFSAGGHTVIYADGPDQHHRRAPRCVRCRVCLPSPFEDAAGYIASLCEVATDEGADLLVPTGTEVLVAAAHRFVLSAFCGVLLDEPNKIRRLGNRWRLARRARELGIAVAETRLARSQAELRHALAELGDAVLMQAEPSAAGIPTVLRGSNGWRPRVEVSADTPWVVQRWLEGEPLATYSVAHDGRLSGHVTYAFSALPQTATNRRRRAAQGGLTAAGITQMTVVERPDVLERTARFVEAERFTGQIGFSFVQSRGGQLCLCGCSPWATCGAKLFAAEPDWLGAFVIEPQAEPLQPIVGTRRRAKIAVALPGWPEPAHLDAHGRWWHWLRRSGREARARCAELLGRISARVGRGLLLLRGIPARVRRGLPRLIGALAQTSQRVVARHSALPAGPAELLREAGSPSSGESSDGAPFEILKVPPQIASVASRSSRGRDAHLVAATAKARLRRDRRSGSC